MGKPTKRKKCDGIQFSLGKRIKVQAQRKFAQGAASSSGTVTRDVFPVNNDIFKSQTKKSDFVIQNSPKIYTEDFLTYLCYKGSSKVVPTSVPALSYSLSPRKSSDEQCDSQESTVAPIAETPPSTPPVRAFIPFGVRKQASQFPKKALSPDMKAKLNRQKMRYREPNPLPFSMGRNVKEVINTIGNKMMGKKGTIPIASTESNHKKKISTNISTMATRQKTYQQTSSALHKMVSRSSRTATNKSVSLRNRVISVPLQKIEKLKSLNVDKKVEKTVAKDKKSSSANLIVEKENIVEKNANVDVKNKSIKSARFVAKKPIHQIKTNTIITRMKTSSNISNGELSQTRSGTIRRIVKKIPVKRINPDAKKLLDVKKKSSPKEKFEFSSDDDEPLFKKISQTKSVLQKRKIQLAMKSRETRSQIKVKSSDRESKDDEPKAVKTETAASSRVTRFNSTKNVTKTKNIAITRTATVSLRRNISLQKLKKTSPREFKKPPEQNCRLSIAKLKAKESMNMSPSVNVEALANNLKSPALEKSFSESDDEPLATKISETSTKINTDDSQVIQNELKKQRNDSKESLDDNSKSSLVSDTNLIPSFEESLKIFGIAHRKNETELKNIAVNDKKDETPAFDAKNGDGISEDNNRRNKKFIKSKEYIEQWLKNSAQPIINQTLHSPVKKTVNKITEYNFEEQRNNLVNPLPRSPSSFGSEKGCDILTLKKKELSNVYEFDSESEMITALPLTRKFKDSKKDEKIRSSGSFVKVTTASLTLKEFKANKMDENCLNSNSVDDMLSTAVLPSFPLANVGPKSSTSSKMEMEAKNNEISALINNKALMEAVDAALNFEENNLMNTQTVFDLNPKIAERRISDVQKNISGSLVSQMLLPGQDASLHSAQSRKDFVQLNAGENNGQACLAETSKFITQTLRNAEQDNFYFMKTRAEFSTLEEQKHPILQTNECTSDIFSHDNAACAQNAIPDSNFSYKYLPYSYVSPSKPLVNHPKAECTFVGGIPVQNPTPILASPPKMADTFNSFQAKRKIAPFTQPIKRDGNPMLSTSDFVPILPQLQEPNNRANLTIEQNHSLGETPFKFNPLPNDNAIGNINPKPVDFPNQIIAPKPMPLDSKELSAEAKKCISKPGLNKPNESEDHLFYIPLQGVSKTGVDMSEHIIEGVAVKMDTQGPNGPQQRVIMRARLVKKSQIKDTVKKNAKQTGPMLDMVRSVREAFPDATIHIEPPGISKVSAKKIPQKQSVFGSKQMSSKSSTCSSQSSSSVVRKEPLEAVVGFQNETAFPRAGEEAKIVEAPIFRPTEKEFQDPLEFIDRISPIAAHFGLCKIIPPSSFKSECKVLDHMRFTPYNQYPHRMLYRMGPSSREMCGIKKYLDTQGVKFKQPPTLSGIEVDLPRLYHIVQNKGGLKNVLEKEKWQQVASEMNLLPSVHTMDTRLDEIYCKYLLPYETMSSDERKKLFKSIDDEWAKREKRMLQHASNPMEDDSDQDDSDNDITEDIEECVTKGKSTTLANFYRTARNTMIMQFGKVLEPTPKDVETKFWDYVTNQKSHICISTGSIDSGYAPGYGFPSSKSPIAKHPWNLKVLTNNSGSVLRSLGPMMGVTVPTLHVGMLFSTCCWYRDPHGLPWIEYLHEGAPKIWYGIPDGQSARFKETLSKIVPSYCQKKTIWLLSDTTMVPPKMLTDHGVSLCRIEQNPGEFILVFPKAFTSSIGTGYSVSESVYFASNSWLDTAQQDFIDIRNSCEPSMFSLERLIVAISEDVRTPLSALQKVLPALTKVIQMEKQNREVLFNIGLKMSERMQNSAPGRKKTAKQQEEIEECLKCRSTLSLSMLQNESDNSAYCLLHGAEFLTSNKPLADKCKLLYMHSIDELERLLSKLIERINTLTNKKCSGKAK